MLDPVCFCFLLNFNVIYIIVFVVVSVIQFVFTYNILVVYD